MTNIQKELIKIIRHSLNNENILDIHISMNMLKDILNEASFHGLYLFIIDNIDRGGVIDGPNETDIRALKKQALIAAMVRGQREYESHQIIKDINSEGIHYALLKGMGHQMLYPNPITRTYGDIDLLVAVSDLNLVEKILLKQGFRRCFHKDESYHISYEHDRMMDIEVHFKFSPIVGDGGHGLDIVSILESRVKKTFNGIDFYVLGKEERVVYNIIHLSKHLSYEGFGFRQLMDIHFLVCDGKMNWTKIYDLLGDYGIQTFASHLLELCQRLFGVNYDIDVEINETTYELLKEFVVDSGLFGHHDKNHYTDALLSKYASEQNLSEGKKWRYIMTMLFPGKKLLPVKYTYAKNNIILLPVAWIHRLFFELKSNPERIRKVLRADPNVDRMERHFRLRESFGLIREGSVLGTGESSKKGVK